MAEDPVRNPIVNPQALQQSAKILGGASASQVRSALADFYSSAPTFSEATPSPAIADKTPVTTATTSKSSLDTLSPQGFTMDPGLPIQPPGAIGEGPGITIVCTGILNGVIASAELTGLGDPTPL